MCKANETQVMQIRILGFQGLYEYKHLLFVIFLLSYIVIIGGNLLIIILVSVVDHLKIPMFFFLKHLATADLLLTTTVVPMMLDILFAEEAKLSLVECVLQLYCFGIFGFVQCSLIAVMSYDRFLAICHPLCYASIMNPNMCFCLSTGSWLSVTLITSSELIVVCKFNFCGPNSIDHFFCDFRPVMELSTSNISSLMIQDFVFSLCMVFAPFVLIIITYFYIFFTIFKLSSSYGRRKAFSTCSSHLTNVCAYYGTLITVYMIPTDGSAGNINKYRSLLYIVVTPLMNPIIYSFKNKEIKRAVLKLINKIRSATQNI